MRKTVLGLACILLAPMFLVSLTASASYEPWYDLDDNGKIDIYDVVKIASTYGTTGDPGKNVNVTNWPQSYKIDSFIGINVTWDSYGQSFGHTVIAGDSRGFTRMSVQIIVYNSTPTSANMTTISCPSDIYWRIGPLQEGERLYPHGIPESDRASITLWMGSAQRTGATSQPIEVAGPTYELGLGLESDVFAGSMLVDVYVYLRNE